MRPYPSMIMLVGEYGVLTGGSALTVPFQKSTETPLHFMENGEILEVDFDPCRIPGGYRFFLLDSGERFETALLEQKFLQQMKDPGFASSIRNEYLVINQKLIGSLLGHREADPGLLVRIVSDYQLTHLREMIPPAVQDLWIEGQVSNEFYLKLNGSGDGSVLGITHENSMEMLQERWQKNLIWIE